MPRNRFPFLSSLSLLWLIYVGLCTGCESHLRPTPAPGPPQSQTATKPSSAELVPDQSTPITVPVQLEPAPWETPEGLLMFVAEHQLTDEDRQKGLQQIARYQQPDPEAKMKWIAERIFSQPVDPSYQLSRLSQKLSDEGKTAQAIRVVQLIPAPRTQRQDVFLQDFQARHMSASGIVLNSTDTPPNTNSQCVSIAEIVVHSGVEAAIEKSRKIENPADRDAALSCMIPYLTDRTEFDDALKLAEAIQAPDQQIEAWALIARKQIKANQLEVAIRLVDRMNPSEETYFIKQNLLFKIASRLVQTGQLNRALQLAETVKDPELQNQVLESIVLKLITEHQFQQALELCQQVKNYESDSAKDYCFSALVTHSIEAGQLDLTLKVINTVEADSVEKWFAIDDLIKHLLETQKLDQALQTARKFENDEDRWAALESISECLANQGRFQQALEVAESIEKGYKKQSALAHLAEKQFQCGQLEQVVNLLLKHADSDLLADDFEPGLYHDANHVWHTTVPLYEQLLTALVAARKSEQALQMTETLQDESQKMTALQFLIPLLAEAGYYDRVIELGFNYTTDEDDLSELQSTAVDSLVDAGEYQRAIDLARLTQNDVLRARARYRQVKRLVGQGKLEPAQQLSETIDDPEWKTESQLALVSPLIEQQQFNKAILITQKMEYYSRLKTEAEEKLITALLEAGRVTEATNMACGIWISSARLPALFEVANQLASEPTLQSKLSSEFSRKNRRLKTAFTPEEQQLARQIVKTIQDK
ncbi:hypothetical protein Pan110_08040 [Gimesia panareensis]|nr:hypothetical protein Pan110_08040 [Gimesia panareensis]